MRKFLIAFLTSLTLVACGIPSATDGKRGPQGEDGVGIPGSPGAPGKDAPSVSSKLVVAHSHCEVLGVQTEGSGDYPKYDLVYEVTVLSDESAFVSFVEKHQYRAGSVPNVTSNAAFYMKSEAGYNAAMVESTMWKAEMASAGQAKFSFKPSSLVKTSACK